MRSVFNRLRVFMLIVGLISIIALSYQQSVSAQNDFVVVAAGNSRAVADAINIANSRGAASTPYRIYLQSGQFSFASDPQVDEVVLPEISGFVVIYGQNTQLNLNLISTTQRVPLSVLPGGRLELYNVGVQVKAGSGRAILNKGELRIGDSAFGGASASLNGGGVENRGTLTVERTAFTRVGYVSSSDPGGAIFTSGGLSITCTSFAGSVATKGGAIYVAGGQARIAQSAFSDNRANGGGAIFNATKSLVDAANNWWKSGTPAVESQYLGVDTITAGVAVQPIAQSDPTQSADCRPRAPQAVPALAPRATRSQALPVDALISNQISTRGMARVIVELNMDYVLESSLSSQTEIQAQRASIQQQQSQLLASLSGLNVIVNRQYDFIPSIALTVDSGALDALATSAMVASIAPDRILKFDAFPDYINRIGAPTLWTQGYDGTGYTVAILDTGVSKTHPYINGKVVSEACYSTTYAPWNVTSVCPGGATASTAVGSGVNCSISGCEHGTHVAGIVAGVNGSASGYTLNGVAKGATLIAVQVFTAFNDAADCSPDPAPCIGALDSDIIAGLQRVYALRSTYNIAAVNMSLGGGQYASTCDTANSSMTTAISNLRGANIATAIASGNEYFTGSMSYPACISYAVSVGATSTTASTDTVASFSNHSNLVSVLAPGVSILSSVPGGTFEAWNGTSMATPHVAGTFAVLRQRLPSATVTSIVSALQSTGVGVTRSNITRPRIQIDAAAALLAPIPGLVTATGPTGNITTRRPTLTWTKEANSTQYNMSVWNIDGVSVFSQSIASANACTGNTCSLQVNVDLAANGYNWYIQGTNSNGNGPWSAGMRFDVAIAPGVVTATGPTGNITVRRPTLTWTRQSDSTWYYINVWSIDSVLVFAQSVSAAQVCSGNTCSFQITVDLAANGYNWYIFGWSPGGTGPWNAGLRFDVAIVPGVVTATGPTGNVSILRPTLTWNRQTDSAWYYINVQNSANTSVFTQWVSAAQVCSGANCAFQVTVDLPINSYTWFIQGWSPGGTGPWNAGVSFTRVP